MNAYLQSRTIFELKLNFKLENTYRTASLDFLSFSDKANALKLNIFIHPHGKIYSLVQADKIRFSTLSIHLSI